MLPLLGNVQLPTTLKIIFAIVLFNLFEDFYVITGGRYNDWQAAGESYGNVQDVEDAQFIPYLGMTYRFIPELLAYASYTETFTAQRELDINDNTLAPVTGESQEVGLKSELFNGNLITTLAYFDIQQTNLATPDPRTSELPPTERRYIGSDGISSNGFELDIAGEIYPGLNASIGYTDFDIKGDEQVVAYTPSQLFKLAATYDLALIERLTFGLNMRWQDDIQRSQGVVGADVINAGQEITTHQKAYAIVDLMAKYHFTDSLDLTVNANNVTDEKYLTSLYWAQGFYGAPANYSATMSWRL